jgi:hypothetical protein
MKTIPEIRAMDNKVVIDSFEGVIETAYAPKDPTPAQKNKGIHSQFLLVSDGERKIGVTLLKKHFHIGKDCEGDRFRFESTADDKGNVGGLEVSKFEKDGEIKCGVDVWGSASIYSLEQKEQKEPTEPKVQTEPSTASPTTTEEKSAVQQSATEGALENPTPALVMPRGRIANQARLHLACYLTVKSTHAGEGFDKHTMKDIATSVAIEMNKSGKSVSSEVKAILEHDLIKQGKMMFDAKETEDFEPREDANAASTPDSTPESAPDVSTQPASQEELEAQREAKPEPEKFNKNWKTIKDDNGKLISEMNKEDLIDVLIKYLPFHATESPKIKTVLNAAVRSMKTLELTYCEIYDVLDILLQNDHDKTAIDLAYDEFKKTCKGDDEALCKNILFDQKTFKEQVMNYEKAKG